MAAPKYDDLMNPTLRALQELGGEAHIRDIEGIVAQLIDISEEDLKVIHRGTTTKFVYNLTWARNYLKRYGLIERVGLGIWKLTAQGNATTVIDKDEVKRTVRKLDLESNVDNLEIEIDEEDVTNNDNEITQPFNPNDIKIIVEPKTIDHLVTRLRYNEIDLNTEFQRKGNLWKPEVQSRLIESILLRLPLPAFYFDASNENKWLVVDGLQRLWSLKNFILNPELNDSENQSLELRGLEILVNYNGKGVTYNQLNRNMQRRILETPITTYLIQPGTPKEVKYNVFRRINTGGLGLNSMEIRNALNQGKASEFLKNLSEDTDLKNILSLPDKRMEDRELLLRAYAFIETTYKNYRNPLSTFLDRAMESIEEKSEEELNTIASGIIDAIFFQFELFEKNAFSRFLSSKNQFNSALFEVWISETYKLDEIQRKTLLESTGKFIPEYQKLLENDDFVKAISSGTASKSAVKIRFEKIHNLICKFLQ